MVSDYFASRQQQFMILLAANLHSGSYGDTLDAAIALLDAFEDVADIDFGYSVFPAAILGFDGDENWAMNVDVALCTEDETVAAERAQRAREIVQAALPSATVVPGEVARISARQKLFEPIHERAVAWDKRDVRKRAERKQAEQS